MRLVGVEMENFRSYREPTSLDCSADVVILVGPNGYGKTSFFDAIGWCLFGAIPRLQGSRDAVGANYVLNHFAEDGAAPRVTLHLADDGRLVTLERVARSLQALEDGEPLTGTSRKNLIRGLFPLGPSSLPPTVAAAQSHFYRAFLLGQDQMASFIRDTTPRDRFDALVSLLGIEVVRDFYQHEEGHLGTLQVQVDDLRADELALRQDLQAIREQRQRLLSAAGSLRNQRLPALVSQLRTLAERARDVDLFLNVDEHGLRESADLLGVAQQLEGELQIAIDEEIARVDGMRNIIATWTVISQGRRRRTELQSAREELSQSLQRVTTQVRESRKALRTLQRRKRALEEEKRPLLGDVDDFRAFLRSAVEHLGDDRCPLCEQTVSPTALRSRLEERLSEVPQSIREVDAELHHVSRDERTGRSRVQRQNSREQELREELAATMAQIEELDQLIDEFDANLDLFSDQQPKLLLRDVKELLAQAESRLGRLRRLEKDAKGLSTRAKMLAALDEVAELRREEAQLRRKRKATEARRRSATAIQGTVRQFIRSAKQAEREIVRDLLQERGPLLTALYHRLRPHPIFDELRVDYKKFADRGEAYFTGASREGEANIATTFSSAQLNAVAICVFLSLSLTQLHEGLLTALLDDPIQNMDDFNVLGLLDLMRQVANGRQVVISTHDSQIGELMRRKLRPTEPGHRTITHKFVRYDANGPEFKTEIDEFEEEPYLLALALESRNG